MPEKTRTVARDPSSLGPEASGRAAPTPAAADRDRPTVLHLTYDLGSGGLERMAVNLCNALVRAGYDAHLGTWSKDRAAFYEPLVDPAVRRVRFARMVRRGASAPVRVLRRVLGVRDLAAHLRRHRVAVVHAHSESMLRVAIAARRLVPRVGVVWHHHDGDTTMRPDRVLRRTARRADHVLVVADGMVGWAREELGLDASKVEILANFLDPRAVPGIAADAPPDVPGEAGKRIVCVANFRVQKDHGTMLRSMAEVARAEPRAHLLLVGGPSEPGVWEAIDAEIGAVGLRDHVTMLGERDDVAAILGASTIGTLGSAYEGTPLALLEYGRAGLAVVATAVGGCPAVLDRGRAGSLVPPGDAAAMAAAILRYLRDPGLRAQHGARLRAVVGTRFAPSSTLSSLEDVYADVVRVRSRSRSHGRARRPRSSSGPSGISRGVPML